jgi:hypothetical protein
MKRLVKWCFCLFVGRVAPVATLPSALIEKRSSLGARCRVGSPRCTLCLSTCGSIIPMEVGRSTNAVIGPEMSMLSPKLLDTLSVSLGWTSAQAHRLRFPGS